VVKTRIGIRASGYSCATVYEQKIGALYADTVESALFVKTHEVEKIPEGVKVVTVARDLGECLCSAADYLCSGDLDQTVVIWRNWFGGIHAFLESLDRLKAIIIGYERVEESIGTLTKILKIEPDTKALSQMELTRIMANNPDHFMCAMRSADQAVRIAEANKLVEKNFPEILPLCKKIGWDIHAVC
jgi:hypothetical protein